MKLKAFFQSEASGGIILIITAVLALFAANLPGINIYYENFVHMPVTIQFGAVGFDLSFEHYVNDALMAFFFLAVAIEIKHEMLHGHLSSIKKASFPFFGALGGMVIPALIYFGLNHSHHQLASGWAIPMATDIAFAIGVLSLLGDKVPTSVKVFLLALAVIDDLGAIVVIAVFYTSNLDFGLLAIGSFGLLIMIILNRMNIKVLTPYILIFCCVWYTFLKAGIHATIAGVLAGFIIPNRDLSGRNLAADLEHYLQPYIKWFIIPLFAFINSGVSFEGLETGILDNLPLMFGIFGGLFVGKPIGIFVFTYIASKLNWCTKPASMAWNTVFVVGIICGIGFTMSIFITNLSFPGATEIERFHVAISRLSILGTSTIAAIVGLIATNFNLTKNSSGSKKQQVVA